MGIMYKLLKRKDLTMDAMPAVKQEKRRTLTLEGNIVEEPLEVDDKQFTAEHILQLCKFLAEKSKRNKQKVAYKRQQSPRKSPHYMTDYCNDAFECDEIDAAGTKETVTVLQHDRLHTNVSASTATADTVHVLTDKFSYVTNTANNALSPASYPSPTPVSAACFAQCNLGKRDILLKIRRQIFERKRQRQLAHVQQRFGVWRPW